MGKKMDFHESLIADIGLQSDMYNKERTMFSINGSGIFRLEKIGYYMSATLTEIKDRDIQINLELPSLVTFVIDGVTKTTQLEKNYAGIYGTTGANSPNIRQSIDIPFESSLAIKFKAFPEWSGGNTNTYRIWSYLFGIFYHD